MCPAVATAGAEAAHTTVAVSRDGQLFTIESVSRIVAGRDIAWAVLTDYDGYVDFVPGMTLSRRVGDQPLRIEQRGEFGVLFFRKAVYATLEVAESPPLGIRFRSVSGNLRTLETAVTLHIEGDQVVVTYHSVIEPDFWVPPLIGTPLVRAAIGRRLGAVADEIERRANFGMNQ
jgi:hypothetical protein